MSNKNYVEVPPIVEGWAIRVRFDEIQTLESVVTRKPLEKYNLLAECVQKNRAMAIIESWPFMVILFKNKIQADRVAEELKGKIETLEESGQILKFEPNTGELADSTKNEPKSDA